MPIEVIVAGLPRTGTTSTRMALEQLGFVKVMHMNPDTADPQVIAAWREVYANHFEKTWTSQDWRHFFDKRFPEYVAGVDSPFADFAVEIAQAYPNAKVILQYRDPEKWFISLQLLMKHICFSRWDTLCIWPLDDFYAYHQYMKPRLAWWQNVYNYPNAGKHMMSSYIDKIKSSIAPERILIYKVEDG
ncbi:unnamed protein product [Rotaria sp. Silwood1]|nr:unnamed protein product [Rotaria sp. Silwood1]CAF3691571.1 unnamed protein product [Rotaria sp. Silwood1]CAF4681229.1 unnamed protein product [Rotaria sp. Silwood1]CAF4712148.1 unnamed protein product [Rotaria sp. Silwood1]